MILAGFDEFINRYINDPKSATQLMQLSEIETPTLGQLYRLINTMILKLTQRRCSATPADLSEIEGPIHELFSKMPDKLATLFTTPDQYLELAAIHQQSAAVLLTRVPNAIIPLINTAETLIAHGRLGGLVIDALFEHANQYALNLITNYNQFIELLTSKPFYAVRLYELNPDKIVSLFTSHSQILDLISKDNAFALEILKRHAETIASLFDTESKCSDLKAVCPSAALTIITIQKRKYPHLILEPARQTAGNSASNERPPRYHARTPVPCADYEPQSDQSDCSFYIKFLANLTTLGCGAAILVAGILLLEPVVITVGLGFTALGAYWLHGLFSPKPASALKEWRYACVVDAPAL